MDLNLTAEQQLFIEAARRFLRQHWDRATVRALEAGDAALGGLLWKRVADLGWPGLVLPRAVGGSGGGVVDLCLLAEELGRAAASSPLLASTALGALPISWAATDARHRSWLPRLAAGDAVATMAVLEPGGGDEWGEPATTASPSGRGWIVSGQKILVPNAMTAQLVLVTVALDGQPALVALEPPTPGLSIRPQAVLGGDAMAAVDLRAVAIGPEDVVVSGPEARETIDRALDVATVVQVSYAVGLCEGALDLSVAHARGREQFGRPIGAFQAVAHRCVDMRTATDGARLLALRAAYEIDRAGRAELDVATAKSYANHAVRETMGHAHQIHGAIGFSRECDLHLFSRRGKTFELILGSTDLQLERVAAGIGL